MSYLTDKLYLTEQSYLTDQSYLRYQSSSNKCTYHLQDIGIEPIVVYKRYFNVLCVFVLVLQ